MILKRYRIEQAVDSSEDLIEAAPTQSTDSPVEHTAVYGRDLGNVHDTLAPQARFTFSKRHVAEGLSESQVGGDHGYHDGQNGTRVESVVL